MHRFRLTPPSAPLPQPLLLQDYNHSVLARLTTQNVAANEAAWATRRQAAPAASGSEAAAAGDSGGKPSSSSARPPPPRYFAGSWDALPGLLEGQGLLGGYDVVLTAETIYSLEAMRSLHACLAACLRPAGSASVAYVAAKSYYFGVGGGTDAFSRLVAAEGRFACTTFAVLDDGLSMRREILRLTPLL